MTDRLILNKEPGAHPHIVGNPDGQLYLVTPPALTWAQRTGLLLALVDRMEADPSLQGAEEIRQHILDLPSASR